jgi:hypothetical protein
MTVCPSGCGFQHPQDAIDSAASRAWDNVLITVQVADYPFDNLGVIGNPANHFNVDLNNGDPAHLWIKGIIGSSGTDGTQFPTFHGITSTAGSILRTSGGVQVTLDNIEFSGFDYWNSVLNGSKTTLRNVYIWNSPQGIISSDGPHHDLYVYNSHFARNGAGNGPEHNIYAGSGDNTDVLVVQNSILEQVNVGHDVKSRASSTTLICDRLLINQDNVYLGSELLDCSEGRVCTAHGVQFLNGGANPAWSNNQSFDALRFGADREFVTLTNNYIDLQNSLMISDNDGDFRFINLFKVMSPSPPYSAINNEFVFSSSAHMLHGNNPFVPNRDGIPDSVGSAIVWGNSNYDSSNSANVNLGTIGTTNIVYSDRAAASLPSLGTYPKSYNDAAFRGITPATCTDKIGLVKVPAS